MLNSHQPTLIVIQNCKPEQAQLKIVILCPLHCAIQQT
jgi:hypothetical protein